MIFCRLQIFSKINFFKTKSFTNTTCVIVSSGFDTDKARGSVGPDLGLNHLQRLSADGKICR